MAARQTYNLTVVINPEIKAALQVVYDFSQQKPSQFSRQAILEKLVREGYLRHPSYNYQNGKSEIRQPAAE